MGNLLFGLSVTLIGMLIVFVGLVILILCISLLKRISKEKRKAGDQPAEKAASDMPAEEPAASDAAVPNEGGELIAVLAAAVAAIWEGEQGFVVRRVRRVHISPAWEKAGREEQIYSRM